MTEITRVGADLAQNVIQIHAVDALGKVVSNRPLTREKFMVWCAQLPAGCMVASRATSPSVDVPSVPRLIAASNHQNAGIRFIKEENRMQKTKYHA